MEHDATTNGSLGDTVTRKRKRPQRIVIHFRPKRAARKFYSIKELLLMLVPYVSQAINPSRPRWTALNSL